MRQQPPAPNATAESTPSSLQPTASGAAAAQPALAPTPSLAENLPATTPSKGGAWRLVLLVLVLAVGGAAYWWSNRPAADYVPKSSGLFKVEVAGKYGFIDRTGNMVIPTAYDGADDFLEGFAQVGSNGKCGYINTNGVVAIPYQFDVAGPFVGGIAGVKLCCGRGASPNDQWGFIDTKGAYVINPQFSAVGGPFTEGLAAVKTSRQPDLLGQLLQGPATGDWGYVDGKGKLVIPAKFESASAFQEGLAAVTQGGRVGYIDKSGKFAINPQFEGGETFHGGLAAVRMGGKWGYVDHSGKYVINPQFAKAEDFEDGAAVVLVGDKPGTIDKTGKFLINPGQFLTINGPEWGELGVETSNGGGIMDMKGNWVMTPNFLVHDVHPLGQGVARARIGDDECVIEKSGSIIFGRFKGMSLATVAAGIESEKQAIATLRALNAAQLTYASTYPEAGFADGLSKLGPPPSGKAASGEHAGLIDAELANGRKGGYAYDLIADPHEGVLSAYILSATPVSSAAGNTYCSDESGAVRYAKPGEACSAQSPVVPVSR